MFDKNSLFLYFQYFAVLNIRISLTITSVFISFLSSYGIHLNYVNIDLPIDTISVQKKLYSSGKKQLQSYEYESAYRYFYKSLLISKTNSDSLYATKSLYKLAKIDFYNSDYSSCEHNLTQALTYRPKKFYTKYSLLCYNLMGLNLKAKGNQKDAIHYFENYRKAYLKKKDTLNQFITFTNNMGMVYQDLKDYTKSIFYYNKLLQLPQIKKQDSVRFARALDNKAWSLFQNQQNKKALPLFTHAKDIRLKIKDQPGLVMSYYHLASYLQNQKNQKKATEYCLQSLQIAYDIGNIEAQLKALFLLSKIEATGSHSFFKKYKKIRDSLVVKERHFKHQTSRIRYETSEKEAEIRLQKAKVNSKNKIILGFAFTGLFFASSSFLFYLQKRKIHTQKKHIQKLQTEVHHTAKNNLGMTIKFINKVKDNPSPQRFLSLEKRINSMLLLHELLYQKEGDSPLDLKEYIESICNSLHTSYASKEKDIHYIIDIQTSLTYKKASKIGIILNELVTNIYKYAFFEKKMGEYQIFITQEKDKKLITVTDNGVGFPNNFDINNLNTYGLRLIKGLITQLNGRLETNFTSNKTEFRIFV